MPLSKDDLDAIARLVDRRIEDRTRPLENRVLKHSGKFNEIREEVSPAVARRMTESQHDIDEQLSSYERQMRAAINRIDERVDGLTKSIPPAASAAKGAELAAVAGAQASVRTEGKTDAVQVAANRADAQSLAAKLAANRAVIIVIVQTIAIGIWHAVQQIILHQ